MELSHPWKCTQNSELFYFTSVPYLNRGLKSFSSIPKLFYFLSSFRLRIHSLRLKIPSTGGLDYLLASPQQQIRKSKSCSNQSHKSWGQPLSIIRSILLLDWTELPLSSSWVLIQYVILMGRILQLRYTSSYVKSFRIRNLLFIILSSSSLLAHIILV